MKIRTCPNCGNKYSFLSYVKKSMFKLIDSKWDCVNCGAELSFNIGRRTLLTMIAMFPIMVHSFITDLFQDLGLSSGVSWILLLMIFLVWVIWIYSYDTFTLLKKK